MLSFYRNAKVGTKTTLFFGIIIACMIISAFVGITSLTQVGNEIKSIAEEDIPLTVITTELTINQLEQAINFERALRYAEAGDWTNYEIAKEQFNHFAALSDAEFIEAEEMVEGFIEHSNNSETREEFEHVDKLLIQIEAEHAEFESEVHQVFYLIESGDMDAALEHAEIVEVEEEQIDHELEALLVELEIFTLDAALQAEADEQAGLMGLFISTAIAGVVGVASIIMVRRMIAPLSHVNDVARKLAKNDLTSTMTVSNSRDEIGLINNAEKLVLDNLIEIITKIKSTAKSVADDSNGIATSTEQLNGGVEQIASTVNQISTGTQLQATELANTKAIIDSVTNTGDSNDGSSASDKMKKIVELTNASSVKINGLAEKSSKITSVVEVIRGIAEKTNLLALNAAIEAARAGESGRGFAVVADEVRRLAEGSAKSSQEIDTLLKDIQDEIQSTVTGIDESAKEIEAGRVVVDKSLKALDDIGAKVQTISSAAEENAASAEEASASVEEQTAASNEISAASKNMASLARELEEIVSVFKLPDVRLTQSIQNEPQNKKPENKKRSFNKMKFNKNTQEETIEQLIAKE